jgi:hypothetical protein
MAWPPGEHLQTLIENFSRQFRDARIRQRDADDQRAFVELEGWRNRYRVIVSEIHRSDASVRYAYLVFDADWHLQHGFDNSADREALRTRYGADWTLHLYEETPHYHAPNGQIQVTKPMDFDSFLIWLKENL